MEKRRNEGKGLQKNIQNLMPLIGVQKFNVGKDPEGNFKGGQTTHL